jgi:SAM-dependent methyltransferase
MSRGAGSPAYVCPRCGGGVARRDDAYRCPDCAAHYPILCGIPDFRLAPDPYLSLEEERAKAARLYVFGRDHGFEALLDEYYGITSDVPPAQAARFGAYVRSGVARGETVLAKLGAAGSGPLLDVGCGAGGLLVAAARQGRPAIGLDIALRWLVIAARRLEEEGLPGRLVCADLHAPPFPAESFGAVAAADVFEHLGDALRAARAIGRLAAPGARIYVAGANRFTLAPYPLAGLFGVGFMPAALRRRYVRARLGLDTLRHARLLTPGAVRRGLRAAGLRPLDLAPLEVPLRRGASLGPAARVVLPVYAAARTLPVLRQIMVRIGPAFELILERPAGAIAEKGKQA